MNIVMDPFSRVYKPTMWHVNNLDAFIVCHPLDIKNRFCCFSVLSLAELVHEFVACIAVYLMKFFVTQQTNQRPLLFVIWDLVPYGTTENGARYRLYFLYAWL